MSVTLPFSKAALDVETQTAIVGVAFSHVTISFYSIYAIYHDPAIWICTSVKEILKSSLHVCTVAMIML